MNQIEQAINRAPLHSTPLHGFHMTVTKIQTKKTIDPTEILLSRWIRAAEN